jgi:hypothetical protein
MMKISQKLWEVQEPFLERVPGRRRQYLNNEIRILYPGGET